MNVVLFNGSPRKNGNTHALLQVMSEVFISHQAQCDIVQVGGQLLHGCTACMKCKETQNEQCVFQDDPVNEYIQKMKQSDAIIIGSPVYFSQMTPEIKALIDRCGYVARANNKLFSRKIGAAVAVARRAGMMPTFHSINDFFFINDMILPGSDYWNVGIARDIGEISEDKEAIHVMERLAENIVWLHQKINR